MEQAAAAEAESSEDEESHAAENGEPEPEAVSDEVNPPEEVAGPAVEAIPVEDAIAPPAVPAVDESDNSTEPEVEVRDPANQLRGAEPVVLIERMSPSTGSNKKRKRYVCRNVDVGIFWMQGSCFFYNSVVEVG